MLSKEEPRSVVIVGSAREWSAVRNQGIVSLLPGHQEVVLEVLRPGSGGAFSRLVILR